MCELGPSLRRRPQPSSSLQLVAVAVTSAVTCSFGAAGSIRSFSAATLSSLSILQDYTAKLTVALLHSGGRGPAPSSADNRVTLQLDACRQLRPCSVERRQLLALQISACRRPRPCNVEPSSAGLFVLVSFWLDCMVHPAHPASFLRVPIPCSPSKYSRGLSARLHGHWRALRHRLRQGTQPPPLPRLAS
jgi:hypothetical protein